VAIKPTINGRTTEEIQGKGYKTLTVSVLLHVGKHAPMFLKQEGLSE
jgi:hypothetical protein